MAFLNPRMYEAMSAMQKSIRRGMEAEAGYWAFWLADHEGFHIAVGRLFTTVYEDIGDPQTIMFVETTLTRAQEWYKKKKDDWRMPFGAAILAMCRSAKTRELNHYHVACRAAVEDEPNREVPDFALCMHTARGRRMGRGLEHFFEEGAKLEPPAEKDEFQDAAYEWWRKNYKKGDKRESPATEAEQSRRLF